MIELYICSGSATIVPYAAPLIQDDQAHLDYQDDQDDQDDQVDRDDQDYQDDQDDQDDQDRPDDLDDQVDQDPGSPWECRMQWRLVGLAVLDTPGFSMVFDNFTEIQVGWGRFTLDGAGFTSSFNF